MSGNLENVKTLDLEEWLTLNTAAAPTKLKQGQAPDMQNVWVDEKPGSVITAPGYRKVGTIPSGNPVSFCINYFKTSAGTQTFVVSDNQTVWTTVDFQNFTSIITGLSSTYQLRGLVVRDKLWLTNGTDSVRTFDGTSVVVLDGTAGTPNVPKGRFIAYHDERVWLYHVPSARSLCYFSALTDSSATIIAPDNASAWPVSNSLQISEGDADFGTGLLVYRGSLHFLKQYSIWRLAGYDEYTYTRVKTRASTGSRFNESIQILDSLVHLIGVDGIYVFDGEESDRISDIIDPDTASQTAFGFNQLQQPNTNNQFWEVTATSDWNAGTVPTNVSIDNSLTFLAADDSQTDFQAGVTQTNIDTTELPGSIKLSRQSSGGSSDRVGQGVNAYLDDSGNGLIIYGTPQWLTDGDTSRNTGFGNATHHQILIRFVVDLTADQSTHVSIGRIIVRRFSRDNIVPFSIQVNTGTYQPLHGTQGTWVTVGTISSTQGYNDSPVDLTFDFSDQNAIQVSIFAGVNDGSYSCAEIEVYRPKYQTSGQFISKTLDYSLAPTSYGNFNVDVTDNGMGIDYFTQSSDDNSIWDSSVACVNAGTIGSTLRRYLRWGANFSSDGTLSQIINAVYVGTEYISAIHDTGGNIFAWGPIEAPDTNYAGQTINFYYRGATSSGGVTSAGWNLIVPGGVPSMSITFRYIQFKLEILGGDSTHIPVVQSVTLNWIAGTGVQPQTLQNVASAYWRNRYWLSAAGPSATSNNTILIRGKKTFSSPWMLKDWQLLSFTRFQDSLYGGSSVDGSIYQLDTGYSKNGMALDSYFETGDFTFGGFTANVLEILVEAERTGPWNLEIGLSIDGGRTFDTKTMDLSMSTFDNEYIKRFNFSTTTTRFRLRFQTTGVDTPFQLHRCIVFYTLNAARGSIRGDYQ